MLAFAFNHVPDVATWDVPDHLYYNGHADLDYKGRHSSVESPKIGL